MARYYGKIGYGESVEKPENSGIWVDQITERPYYGSIVRNVRKLRETDKVNSDVLATSNSISIVADAYANEHFFAIRYIWWAGATWIVTDVEVQPPRLLLRLGGVYNGPTARATPDSENGDD